MKRVIFANTKRRFVKASKKVYRAKVNAAAIIWDEPKKSSSPKYESRTTCTFNNVKYAVYFTSALGGKDSACVYALKPYDDADRISAFLANGTIQYQKNNKVIEKVFAPIEPEDQEIHDEDLNDTIEQMIQHIAELDMSIEPKIINNSSVLSANDINHVEGTGYQYYHDGTGYVIEDNDNNFVADGFETVEEVLKYIADLEDDEKLLDHDVDLLPYDTVEECSDNITSAETISDEVMDVAEEIREQCYDKVLEYMTGPEGGFTKDEAKAYIAVDATFDKNYGEDYLIIELRAEVDYEGLEEIFDMVNPIVATYDSDAYFDAAQPGIGVCWINCAKLAAIASSTSIKGMYQEDLDNFFTKEDVTELADAVQYKLDDLLPAFNVAVSDFYETDPNVITIEVSVSDPVVGFDETFSNIQ